MLPVSAGHVTTVIPHFQVVFHAFERSARHSYEGDTGLSIYAITCIAVGM